jgi:hypothetical protein
MSSFEACACSFVSNAIASSFLMLIICNQKEISSEKERKQCNFSRADKEKRPKYERFM